jgi:hypothetical protein
MSTSISSSASGHSRGTQVLLSSKKVESVLGAGVSQRKAAEKKKPLTDKPPKSELAPSSINSRNPTSPATSKGAIALADKKSGGVFNAASEGKSKNIQVNKPLQFNEENGSFLAAVSRHDRFSVLKNPSKIAALPRVRFAVDTTAGQPPVEGENSLKVEAINVAKNTQTVPLIEQQVDQIKNQDSKVARNKGLDLQLADRGIMNKVSAVWEQPEQRNRLLMATAGVAAVGAGLLLRQKFKGMAPTSKTIMK